MKLKLPLETASFIKTLHPDLKKKVRHALEAISVEPGSGKHLKEELSGFRSFKVGRHRIIYRLAHEMIEIIAIGPRRTVYLDTFQKLKRMKP